MQGLNTTIAFLESWDEEKSSSGTTLIGRPAFEIRKVSFHFQSALPCRDVVHL